MVTSGQRRSFQLLETLGSGGFGTVYLAQTSGSGGFTKLVALKLLRTDTAMPAEMLPRLRDEARILGLIRHRAVVGVDGLIRLEQGWAVVMEYVEGLDCSNLLEEGPMPPRVALEVVEEVASALHAAWIAPTDKNATPLELVHRDIKPANVRVTADGQVKVLDFGVARASFGGREAATSSLLFGSTRYMAPERLSGADGPEGDVYSLGVLLVDLLTGTALPFTPSRGSAHRAQLRTAKEIVTDSLVNGAFPCSVEETAPVIQLLSAMLSDSAEKRPTAKDVALQCRDLQESAKGPRLRSWAAERVTSLRSALPRPSTDPVAGMVLQELTETLAIPQPAPSPSLMPWVVGTLSAGMFGLATLGALAVGLLIWSLRDTTEPVANPAEAQESVMPVAGSEPPNEAAPAPTETVGAPAPIPETTADTTPSESVAGSRTPSSKGKTGSTTSRTQQAERDRASTKEESTKTKVVPPPPPPAPTTGFVHVTGDAKEVWFVRNGRRYTGGSLAPGRYEIKAEFGSRSETVAGKVDIVAGKSVTIKCTAAFAQCR